MSFLLEQNIVFHENGKMHPTVLDFPKIMYWIPYLRIVYF